MKQLQQYQLAYISKQTLGKNPYTSFNSNPTASQQKLSVSKFSHLLPLSSTPVINIFLNIFANFRKKFKPFQ
jgi:hypothetical protein